MKDLFTQQLENIISGMEINNKNEFSVIGRSKSITNPHAERLYHDQQRIEDLKNYIYTEFYAKSYLSELDKSYSERLNDTDFLRLLKLNNHGETHFSESWNVNERLIGGDIYAIKGNYVSHVKPGDYVFTTDKNDQETSQVISILNRKEAIYSSNPFYFVNGNTLVDSECQYIRFYFNTSSDGALAIVDYLTRVFNDKYIPFRFKCLSERSLFTRTDSSVLYLDKKYSNYAFLFMEDLIESIKEFIKPEVPYFTYKITEGVGFCEDPRTKESFGESRSRVIAKILMEIKNKNQERTKWLEYILSKMSAFNFNIESLYLNPRSSYHYEFLKTSLKS